MDEKIMLQGEKMNIPLEEKFSESPRNLKNSQGKIGLHTSTVFYSFIIAPSYNIKHTFIHSFSQY